MTENTYKVPVKQWRKWPEPARAVFNGAYGELRLNQAVVAPDDALYFKRQWDVIAWNAAWIAADHAKAATRQ